MKSFSLHLTPNLRLCFFLHFSRLPASRNARRRVHTVGHRKDGDWEHRFWLVWFAPGRRSALSLRIVRGWTKRDQLLWQERYGPEREAA